MKKLIILSITLLCFAVSAFAQTDYPAKMTNADVALSFGNGFSTAFSYNKLWGLGAKKRFKIGAGARLTSFFGSKLDFITAPANLTSKPEMVDTVNFASVQSNALNLNIQLQYSFNKLDIGFNIDAIGASFGAGQSGKVAASTSTLNKSTQAAKLTGFNVLLVGDNDLGSLNSELYARYWFTEKIGLRVGGSFQFIEYTTDKVIAFDNQRFRIKTLQPFIALSIRL
jgi:hypothetical protein